MPDPSPDVVQPPRVLKAFERAVLDPRQSRRITFRLDGRAFEYWNQGAAGWRTAPGCYRVAVGFSSRDLPLGGAIAKGGAACGGELGLPRAGRRCLSRRDFRIRLRDPRGAERLTGARVTVNGRRVRTRRRGGRIVARVNLRGVRKGRVRVTVTARTSQGRTVRERRTYRTCVPRRRARS